VDWESFLVAGEGTGAALGPKGGRREGEAGGQGDGSKLVV
jgi:hypothetical protein